MGWMETCAMEERMRLVIAFEDQEEAFAVLCRRLRGEPQDRLQMA